LFAILVQDYLLVVEFLVIVSIINKAVAVEVFGLPEQGVLSTCHVLRIPEGSYLYNIALLLNL
jgi:hypothetical protein